MKRQSTLRIALIFTFAFLLSCVLAYQCRADDEDFLRGRQMELQNEAYRISDRMKVIQADLTQVQQTLNRVETEKKAKAEAEAKAKEKGKK